MAEEKLLEYAALAESVHLHIRSVRVCRKPMESRMDRSSVADIEEISGNGVTAKVDGTAVAVGNAKLMKQLGISMQWNAIR